MVGWAAASGPRPKATTSEVWTGFMLTEPSAPRLLGADRCPVGEVFVSNWRWTTRLEAFGHLFIGVSRAAIRPWLPNHRPSFLAGLLPSSATYADRRHSSCASRSIVQDRLCWSLRRIEEPSGQLEPTAGITLPRPFLPLVGKASTSLIGAKNARTTSFHVAEDYPEDCMPKRYCQRCVDRSQLKTTAMPTGDTRPTQHERRTARQRQLSPKTTIG